MSERLSIRHLNRATLARQGLVDRFEGEVAEVVGRVAGLQAQHANWPYVALWSRRTGQTISELEQALESGAVVKATLMRATLHLVDSSDFLAYDAATAPPRIAAWTPTAREVGVDLIELNAELLRFCQEPRSVSDIEAHLTDAFRGKLGGDEAAAGVRNVPFRMASAAGGLVHAPPSGMWKWHGKPNYVAANRRLGKHAVPSVPEALAVVAARYLRAYGPVSVADFVKYTGSRKVTDVRAALDLLGDAVISREGLDGVALVDLAESDMPGEDAPAPARFLARWDSVLIGYDARDRILPPEYKAAVIKKNGDFLPTFLVDGVVAGLWSVEADRKQAVLKLAPFQRVPARSRKELEAEGEALVRYVEPEADRWGLEWAT